MTTISIIATVVLVSILVMIVEDDDEFDKL